MPALPPLRRLRGHGPTLRRAVWLLLLALLVSCGGDLQTPGEALRIFGSGLPRAYVGEEYRAQVRAVGGLRPFSFELAEGELPPGLQLSGGMITGIPTATGSYEFTIAVSDANLSSTFADYSLEVVERPPPVLSVVAPLTEIRDATVLRLRLENASLVRAVSARLTWDAELLELEPGSVSTAGGGRALLWEEGEGWLQIDLAALGDPFDGEQILATFTLTPRAPTVPGVGVEAVFLDDRSGRSYQAPTGHGGPPADSEPAEDGLGEEGAGVETLPQQPEDSDDGIDGGTAEDEALDGEGLEEGPTEDERTQEEGEP